MRSSGKIAIKKVNQRLEEQELQEIQPFEAYKFRVEKDETARWVKKVAKEILEHIR